MLEAGKWVFFGFKVLQKFLTAAAVIQAGHTRTPITHIQHSPLFLRHPQSSPAPSPGWCPRGRCPGEREGEEGRWGRSRRRHRSDLRLENPTSPLCNREEHLRSFANGHRRRGPCAGRARCRLGGYPRQVSPAPRWLLFGLPRNAGDAAVSPQAALATAAACGSAAPASKINTAIGGGRPGV